MGESLPILNKLGPLDGKGSTSVAQIPKAWYVACLSTELKQKPMARKVLGWPLVLFRDEGVRLIAWWIGVHIATCLCLWVESSMGNWNVRTMDGDLMETVIVRACRLWHRAPAWVRV